MKEIDNNKIIYISPLKSVDRIVSNSKDLSPILTPEFATNFRVNLIRQSKVLEKMSLHPSLKSILALPSFNFSKENLSMELQMGQKLDKMQSALNFNNPKLFTGVESHHLAPLGSRYLERLQYYTSDGINTLTLENTTDFFPYTGDRNMAYTIGVQYAPDGQILTEAIYNGRVPFNESSRDRSSRIVCELNWADNELTIPERE